MTPPLPKAAFELQGAVVRLDKLLPRKVFAEIQKQSPKHRSLVASIKEVGLVEPLSVYPQKGGKYLLLDGHARVEALRELGTEEALCLIALQPEAYTYNQKVSRIAPIQANRMILKALSAGVPEERIAKALDLSVQTVRRNRKLLEGICPEAVDVLRDKHVAQEAFALLKKVRPVRQIEIAELMVSMGDYSAGYARILVQTTQKEYQVDPEGSKKPSMPKSEEVARVEHEVRLQEKEIRMLDESYNQHVMMLTLARGYLRPLLGNGKVVRFLAQHFREILDEFQRITEMTSLE